MNKLHSRRGETLAETLATILLIAISAGLLVTMTGAAVRMNTRANQAAEELYEEISMAELGNDAVNDAAVISERSNIVTLPILRSGDGETLTSYRGVG